MLIIRSLLLIVLLAFGATKNYPPGTVNLSANLYLDQTEVSNMDWMEYLIWLRQEYGEASDLYKNAFPDNETWKSLYQSDFMILLVNNESMYFPVVGISYEQAVEYCQWRTARVNENFDTKNKVIYRLPSLEELSSALTTEKKPVMKSYNAAFNLYSIPEKTKGKFFLFLSANVSEITNVEGTAFGVNFMNSSPAVKTYFKPEKWLGFRCVAEITD